LQARRKATILHRCPKRGVRIMTTPSWRLTFALAVFTATSAIIAAEWQQHPDADEPNAVFTTNAAINTFGGPSQAAEQMRLRLKDPEQRKALRAEQRASVREWYPEIGEAVGVDAATEEKLIELLTDQQMQDLENFDASAQPAQYSLQAEADARSRKLDQLRELLGEQGLERYQDYMATLGERSQVRMFDARLDAADKLQPEQKTRLMSLFREQQPMIRSHRFAAGLSPLPPESLSRENMQRAAQLNTIALNEASLRQMKESHPAAAREAAKFLTPMQLKEFERMNAEQEAALQHWLEGARAQAGLKPDVPAVAEDPPDSHRPQRKPVTGRITLELNVTVDSNAPTALTHVGLNGEAVTFETADGLVVEATPTLFEDHWLDVELAWFEKGRNGKRRLQETSAFGVLTRMPDGSANGRGGTTMLVTGSKVYAIVADATAAKL
jgi:hypothetical protein